MPLQAVACFLVFSGSVFSGAVLSGAVFWLCCERVRLTPLGVGYLEIARWQ